MGKRLICGQGHQWVENSATKGQVASCPICKSSGQPASAHSVSEKEYRSENVTPSLKPPPTTRDYTGDWQRSVTIDPLQESPQNSAIPMAPKTLDDLGAVPSQIPGYIILDVLGRGGMGVVYKARSLVRMQEEALKMILVGRHAGKRELSRFRTEAQAISRLNHPNIVQLHEIGECEGCPYFSLELMEAGSLADQLDGNPWPFRKAARLVRKLAKAIHHAHQSNVVHRDLKPSNVLLAADGTPKITDFGLAKQLDTSGCETPSDAVLGTPSYMAPEQAGQAKHVGPAADVYALGVILYELLIGQPPFQGTTVLEIINQVVADNPVAPQLYRPDLPSDLETICLRCLQKDPAKRFASAQALANDLGRFLADEQIRAKRSRPWDAWSSWVRGNPVPAVLIVLVVVRFLLSAFKPLWIR